MSSRLEKQQLTDFKSRAIPQILRYATPPLHLCVKMLFANNLVAQRRKGAKTTAR